MILDTLCLGEYQSNCYIYASEASKKGVVIDPGSEADSIIKRIREMGIGITHIILTHGHPDHTSAVKALQAGTGAKIAIHQDDVPILKDRLLHTMLGFRHVDVIPNILLSDGETIKTDGVELKVIHTPGHTPGGICLAGQDVVFTGDTLFYMGIGRTDLPGGNSEKLLCSLHEKLLLLPDDTRFYPGHARPGTIGEERRSNPFLNREYYQY